MAACVTLTFSMPSARRRAASRRGSSFATVESPKMTHACVPAAASTSISVSAGMTSYAPESAVCCIGTAMCSRVRRVQLPSSAWLHPPMSPIVRMALMPR